MTDIYLAEIEYYDSADNSTNKLYWSEDVTKTTTWLNFRAGLGAVTANSVNGNDGTLTADTLTLSVNGTRYQPFLATGGVTYTYSLYVKLGTSSNALYIGVWNPDASWITVLSPGDSGLNGVNSSTWTRLSFVFSVTSDQVVWLLLPWSNSANDTKTLYVWGAMVNTGGSAGTYAKTEGAPTRTLRLASHTYITKAADTPASTTYDPRIIQPGLLRREMFESGAAGGAMGATYGIVELANTDGGLDAYTTKGFDGRTYTLKLGDDAAALSTFTTVLTATMEQPEFAAGKLTIRLKSALEKLDKPVAQRQYTGTNSAGTGVEGDVRLKDKRKPICVGGVIKNITPVLVNQELLIYQVHDGAIASLSVHDMGVPLEQGSDITWADLYSSHDSSWFGKFRLLPSAGLFRVFLEPQGQLTAYVTMPMSGDYSEARIGPVMRDLAIAVGWPSASISADDVSALPAYPVSLYLPDGETALEAMTKIAEGIGVWFGADNTGVLRFKHFALPTGDPVAELTDDEIISIDRITSQTPGSGIPLKTVTLNYDKNWTVQPDLTSNVASWTRDWLKQEWRQVVIHNPATDITRPLSGTLTVDAYISTRTAAAWLAQKWMEKLGTPRDRFSVRARVTAAQLASIDLNSVVRVTLPRYGLDAGKLLRVLAIQVDYRTQSLELTLWG